MVILIVLFFYFGEGFPPLKLIVPLWTLPMVGRGRGILAPSTNRLPPEDFCESPRFSIKIACLFYIDINE